LKNKFLLILGIIICLVIAASAYLHATSIMNSLYVYRSPLHNDPPTAGKALGHPITHRVVFVLIDALRVDTAQDVKVMPYLNELRDKGASATVHSRMPSYSDPGWTALMTGAWPDISDGPAMNTEYENTPTWTQDNIFSAAHRAGFKTALSGYYWWEKLVPREAVDIYFTTAGEDRIADQEVVNASLPWIKNGEYAFILIHIDQVDYAGHHEGGPQASNWDTAATRADQLLKAIVSKMDLINDTVIVVSDHGQIDQGGHGGPEKVNLVEPFVMVGAGIKPGIYDDIQQVDVAPTISALLGLNIPASAQGVVQTEMLSLSSGQIASIEGALLTQKMQLETKYLKAIGVDGDIKPTNSVPEILAAMDDARANRLKSERLPRIGWMLLLALVPAIILVLKRNKTIAWLAIGGVVYLVVFNIRYLFLAHKTYSLSSVASANDLILNGGLTAALAFLITWLVTIIGLRSFKDSATRAVGQTLGLIFFTLYLLALPVMWSFAMNGGPSSWTLPETTSRFLEVLFTLQGMVVAVVGLLLSVVAVLIAGMKQRKNRQPESTGEEVAQESVEPAPEPAPEEK
jgi:hypothetical protein